MEIAYFGMVHSAARRLFCGRLLERGRWVKFLGKFGRKLLPQFDSADPNDNRNWPKQRH